MEKTGKMWENERWTRGRGEEWEEGVKEDGLLFQSCVNDRRDERGASGADVIR